MKEKLLAKLQMYQEMKCELAERQFNVEDKVQEYRTALLRELEKDRQQKLEKLDVYIELLESLIAEIPAEEAPAEEIPAEELKEELPEQPIEEIKEEEV